MDINGLIQPSIEREIRNELTDKGEEQAIHIFSENLTQSIVTAAIKRESGFGCRSAYRTGCKLAAN